MLDLQNNMIGDDGAKYLAEALMTNTVKFIVYQSHVDLYCP